MNTAQEINAQVPGIRCIGKCQQSCGPVPTSSAEATLMRKAGFEPPDIAEVLASSSMSCPHLGALGQCVAHEVRPLLCRLWGVVESMPCEWGCKPERTLTDHEGRVLLTKMAKLKP